MPTSSAMLRRRANTTLALCLLPAAIAVAYHYRHPARGLPSRSGHSTVHAGRKVAAWDPIDPQILSNGSRVAARDLAYLERVGTRLLDPGEGSAGKRADGIRETLRAMKAAWERTPQASLFRARVSAGGLDLLPEEWSDTVTESSRVRCDLAIVGAELSSLSAAMEAADRGASVTLVYVPPLGGIAADTGANQRYFDCMPGTPHPAVQTKLFRNGLGMHNWFGIPDGVDSRLKTYLGRAYKNRIRLVPTRSYDSLHVELRDHRVESVLTAEGARVAATTFVDSDPESRIAEKAGIPYEVDTPHLSYGLVFDVRGFSGRDYLALRGHERIAPAVLMARAGVTSREVAHDPRARASLALLQRQLPRDVVRGEGRCWFGFRALAQAYDFWMDCRGIHDRSPQLRWLNERRVVSGFNLCELGPTGTFNSISYRIQKNLLQYSHSVERDEELAPIRDVEGPGLSEFFRYVTGNPRLSARVPPQLYVRKSTAFFRIAHPYAADEFRRPAGGAPFMLYAMDLRDLHQRDAYGWEVVRGYLREAQGKHEWAIRPSTTETGIPNLYLLNKCGVTPAYSGGLRIEQNQISTGVMLVDELLKDRSRVARR